MKNTAVFFRPAAVWQVFIFGQWQEEQFRNNAEENGTGALREERNGSVSWECRIEPFVGKTVMCPPIKWYSSIKIEEI